MVVYLQNVGSADGYGVRRERAVNPPEAKVKIFLSNSHSWVAVEGFALPLGEMVKVFSTTDS